MTTGRRMGLAFCCVLLAIAALGLLEITMTAIRQPRMVGAGLGLLSVYLLYALPGWFMALPFVFLFKDAEGHRAWLVLIIGTAIGPSFMLAWMFLASGSLLVIWRSDGEAIVLSLLIAFFTSAFYVLLLRRFTPEPHRPPQQTPDPDEDPTRAWREGPGNGDVTKT